MIRDENLLSANEFDILLVLRGKELYGLEILEIINTCDRPVELKYGSLYPTLDRLEKRDFIEYRWGDETELGSGARRKYYKVLPQGMAVLRAWESYRKRLSNGGQ